jgi:hypothetical protein
VVIANAPHPIDPRPTYSCSTLEVLAWNGTPTGRSDPLWTASPEGERAFENTADYLKARGYPTDSGYPTDRQGIA